jgi:hypothetical protein
MNGNSPLSHPALFESLLPSGTHKSRQLAAFLPLLRHSPRGDRPASRTETVALRGDYVRHLRRQGQPDDTGLIHTLDKNVIAANVLIARRLNDKALT